MFWWDSSKNPSIAGRFGVRPVVVVSNNMNNQHSGTVTIVPLTSTLKTPYPHQAPLIVAGRFAIALCGQVVTVPESELEAFLCKLEDFQMKNVNDALRIYLGL